ncbi:MAG: CHRD domain-containing protein [Planctomycetes bacterium]|nr:CHRD domain-containing protein [Planctomycetota bacterium]
MQVLSKLVSSLVLLASVVPAVSAQTMYRADLDAGQVVPSVASSACGYATFQLQPDDTLSYDLRTIFVSGTAARLRIGAAGGNGALLHTLTGGPGHWSGSTPALGASDIATLRAEGLYVVVESAAHPDGETRGQVLVNPRRFTARLTPGQQNPPVASAGSGVGMLVVNPDMTVTYEVTVADIPTVTVAHVHTAPVGTNGPVLFPLVNGPPTWSGSTAPVFTSELFDQLQAGGMYFNVHSGANPTGDVRGQIVAEGMPYFAATACAPVVLAVDGPAVPGGLIDVAVSQGVPSSFGYLLVSLDADLFPLAFEPFLLDPTQLVISSLVVPLDGAGEIAFSFELPDFSLGGPIFWQFIDLDASAPNGKFRISNGVEQRLVALPL